MDGMGEKWITKKKQCGKFGRFETWDTAAKQHGDLSIVTIEFYGVGYLVYQGSYQNLLLYTYSDTWYTLCI